MSREPMLSVSEALEAVLRESRPLPPTRLPLTESLGLSLLEDIAADLDLPPFDKSLVDGFAVSSAGFPKEGRLRLEIIEEIPAGRTPSKAVGPGRTALIMTGAPLPEGADAVVMHEKTTRINESLVEIPGPVNPGQNRLVRGREMRAGEVVSVEGSRIDAVRLGLLASVGAASVKVRPRPKVAVVPTGDELVEIDVVPGPGRIRNSNASMLAAMAKTWGADARAFPIALDQFDRLRDVLGQALGEADVVMASGGVSAGNRDLVPSALESLGVRNVFHKIKLKPGKPLWFGVGPERGDRPGTLVFGLPGNPVSGVVGFLLFVRPALDALSGLQPDRPYEQSLPLSVEFAHRDERPTYHPARLRRNERGEPISVEPLPWAGSPDLRTVASADGFAIFEAGERIYSAGDLVGFLRSR